MDIKHNSYQDSVMSLQQDLIFSFNEIRIDGAMEIVKGIANKSNIKNLNLDGK